jgi:hypothetical protein
VNSLANRAGDADEPLMLSIAYLRTLLKASAWVAIAVGLAGSLITQDMPFTLCFTAAASIDLGTFWAIVADAERRGLDDASGGVARAPLFIGGRLGLKAILMVAAFWVFGMTGLVGATLGVLVVDTTFLVVGPITAARSAFSIESGSRGRQERGE